MTAPARFRRSSSLATSWPRATPGRVSRACPQLDPENRPRPVMKQAIAIVACVLLVTSHALAQSAAPAEHVLPAAEDLGPGWIELSSTLPTANPTYPEARGWY